SGDLDGCGTVAALPDRQRGDILGAAAPDSGRMERDHSGGRGCGSQVAGVRFFVSLGDEIYILVGVDWRSVFDDGEPRNRSDDRAAFAVGTRSARQPASALG